MFAEYGMRPYFVQCGLSEDEENFVFVLGSLREIERILYTHSYELPATGRLLFFTAYSVPSNLFLHLNT